MLCLRDKFDHFVDTALTALRSSSLPERQPFELPGTSPQYAPDRTVDVTHITLTLNFEIEQRTMNGICETAFTGIRDDLRTLTLDAAEMDILGVEDASGDSLSFDHSGDKLQIYLKAGLPQGESASVRIRYRVKDPQLGLYFVLPDENYPDKPVQVWTQGQDNDARYWFPCFDYPNEKASSETIVTVPEQYFVLSNGAMEETSHDEERGTKTYHWKQEIPHVTYLISLVIGEFTEYTEQYNGIPVTYYVPPGWEEEGTRSFGKTPDMMKFFSEQLRFPYPYEKYAQIAVEDFVFGGMENTTATTQTARTLHDERAHLDYESEPLVAHELAHQWFGNLLTCKDWSHAWLNEGFATYLEALYREHDRGEDEFRYSMFQNARRYFKEDRKYRRPVVTNQYREPIDLFDRHLYEKGALVLHMLRFILGEEQFWEVLHTYLKRHQQENVETVDFIRAVESVTGRNMQQFFDEWIFGAGYPEFEVTFGWTPAEDNSHGTAELKVVQKQDGENTADVFHIPMDLVFVTENGERHERIALHERESVFHFRLTGKPEQVRLDPDNWILKTLDLKFPRQMLLTQLREADGAITRIQAIRALENSPSPRVVDALGESLGGDEFWGVRREVARVLGNLKTDRAMRILIEHSAIGHPKARRGIMEALGEYHTESSAETLQSYATGDPSYFVEATANTSLGKTRAEWGYEVLCDSLEKESFNDVISNGAMAGLAELDRESIPDILIEYTASGRSQLTRAAAAETMGKLYQHKEKVKRRLLELLTVQEHFRVKFGTITGLRHLNDVSVVPELKSYADREPNGMLSRLAALAARAISAQQGQSEVVQELRDEMETVRAERRELLSRLDKLEMRLKNKNSGDDP